MNETQFREKLTKYKDMVCRIAYTYTQNLADAEDISQEVFIKLYRSENKFPNEEQEKAWLIRVTINQSKDFLRGRWLKNLFLDQAERVPANEQKPDQLLALVLALPEKYRTVVHLYYYEDYSVDEIAAILGRNTSTIQTQLQRGREKLKQAIGEEGNYEF